MFTDDEPITCEHCNKTIFPPSDYYTYKGEDYCSKKCLGEVLVEENWHNVSERHLYSEEEIEDIIGDFEYDNNV